MRSVGTPPGHDLTPHVPGKGQFGPPGRFVPADEQGYDYPCRRSPSPRTAPPGDFYPIRALTVKRVYSSDNPLIVAHVRQVLEANHITCVTRNEFLQGGAGELPPIECWPELWVLEDFQLEKARALVEAVLAIRLEAAEAWHCPQCREPLEGQFTACWHCGTERPVNPE